MSRPFPPGSDGHALLVLASMFLLLAPAAVIGQVSFLAAPALAFAALSVLRAVQWRLR
jgi:hypothetical protein